MSAHLRWQGEHLVRGSLLPAWSEGHLSSNVDLCSWCRACECTCAQPLSADGQRPQAPRSSQVRMGAAHHAQERRRVRPGEQASRRCVEGLRHPRRPARTGGAAAAFGFDVHRTMRNVQHLQGYQTASWSCNADMRKTEPPCQQVAIPRCSASTLIAAVQGVASGDPFAKCAHTAAWQFLMHILTSFAVSVSQSVTVFMPACLHRKVSPFSPPQVRHPVDARHPAVGRRQEARLSGLLRVEDTQLQKVRGAGDHHH